MRGRTAGKAWISSEVARAMREEAVRAFPLETGGVLLGYWTREYEEVVVTHATGPGPGAVHRVQSFVPDAEYQEAEVARLYEMSGRISTYLGDWHSHPLGAVSLSRRDRRTLRHIARHREARAPMPLMAVIGGGDPEWFLGVWRFAPIRLGVILLRSGIVSLEPRFFDER